MFQQLGDRDPMWTTINEPWVVMEMGYVTGQHPPGKRSFAEAAIVSQQLLRAHSATVAAFRAEAEGQIGLVVNLVPVRAATDTAADRLSARRMDAYLNRHFLDPALLGEFPPELPEMFGASWPPMTPDEQRRLAAPIDFVGVNYYLRIVVRDDPGGGPPRAAVVPTPNCPPTGMGWEIYPQGLAEILQWLRTRYGSLPVYITENGAAFEDEVTPNGSIHDARRVKYLNDHLLAAQRACEAGVDVRGYFVWSLLDNFEWQHGYSQRFGIVHVDYATQRRTPKAAARFYADVIRSHGKTLPDKGSESR